MAEYITDKATVRVHGKCDPEKLRQATEQFLKRAGEQKKKRRNYK